MFFRDLLKSSRLEIITSKRFTAILYGIFATAIFWWWYSACQQFISAYRTTGIFDVSVSEFIIATVLFFAPLLLLGCFITATLLQRFRLRKWYKSLSYYPFYESKLSPAEAGVLVDQELNKAELHATLLDLHYKNNISINFTEKNGIVIHRDLSLEHRASSSAALSNFEGHFIEALFADKATIHLASFEDRAIFTAGAVGQEYLMQNLSHHGLVLKQAPQKRWIQILAKVILYLGGFVGVANAALLVFVNDLVTSLGPNRYPMQESQLYILLLVSITGLVVFLSGFFPRFNASHKDTAGHAWLEAEGFRHYLSTIYRDRFQVQYLNMQEPQTITKLAPFMVAYKIIPLTKELCEANKLHRL